MARSVVAGSGPALSYPLQLLLWVALIAAYRLWVLATSSHTLFADESYYYGWAQQLAWGYYSKPPMVAWLIALTTSVCGDSELCVKLGAWLLYPATTAAVYLLGRELFDDRTGFWAGLAFFTLPVVFVSSQIISTDVLLILYWALALLCFVRALNSDRMLYWVLAGVASGLGLLSKYTMGVFALSALFYLVFSGTHRRLLRRPGPWVAAVIALVVFAPNILWNVRHHFATVMHTAEISQLDQDLFHPNSLAEFFGGQLLVFGVLLSLVFLWYTLQLQRHFRDDRYQLLWWFAVPFVAVISLQALLARAHLNWAAPAYVSATVLVCAWLLARGYRRMLLVAVLLNTMQGVALYHFDALTRLAGIEVTSAIDPYRRIRGWDQVGTEVENAYSEYPGLPLMADNRRVLAQMVYYVRPHPFDAVVWNPHRQLRSHYDLTRSMDDYLGRDFIYITDVQDIFWVSDRFRTVRKLKSIRVPVHADLVLAYDVYYLHDFLGYKE